MEKTAQKNESPDLLRFAGLLLLASVSGVLAALCFAMPGGIAAGILLWPIAGALQARVLTGMKAGEGSKVLAALPLVLTVASVLLVKDAGGIRLSAAALTVPMTATVITVLQIKKLGGLWTSAGAAACGIAGIYSMVCLPGIANGTGAFTAVKNLFAGYAAEMKEMVALFASPALKDAVADFSQQLDELVELVPDVTTGGIFYIGFIGGLGTVLLYFALTAKRRGSLGIAKPGRVATWSIPKIVFRPVFIFYLISAVLYMFDVANAVSIYYVVSTAFTFLTVINGFATAEWLLEHIRRKQGLFRALAYALTAALPVFAVSPLSTLGFVDCIFGIRRRFAARKSAQQ